MSAIAAPSLTSALVNRVLAIKPLWNLAKGRARAMMIKRAETIGVPWRETVRQLESRDAKGLEKGVSPAWATELAAVQNPDLVYPDYYTTSFHAYDEGNLGWLPAMEVEVAAKAVHARLWPDAGAQGDAMLRQSYHDVLQAKVSEAPRAIADLGCGVGMSTETLQDLYPEAQVTGVDLSPYFLAVAKYRQEGRGEAMRRWGDEEMGRVSNTLPPHPQALPAGFANTASPSITWHHAPAEATNLPAASYDLVSVCLVFHELPQSAARSVLREARRLLRPGGHLAIMDMNPRSQVYESMPPFVLTLLKSTEPYLDEYFALDMEAEFDQAGFERPSIQFNTARHRTIIGRARDDG